MSAGDEHLLLYGIFLKLREAGMPLEVRDYLEALRALSLYEGLDPFDSLSGVSPEGRAHAGTGWEPPAKSLTYRVRAGAELVWLCQVLWARSQDERNIVERVITLEIEMPPPRLVRELHDLLKAHDADPPNEPQAEPAAVVPFETAEAQQKEEQPAGDAQGEREGVQTEGDGQPPPESEEAKTIPVDIVAEEKGDMSVPPPEEEGDMSLPPLDHPETGHDLTFLPVGPPLISPLWLVALWRRYFVPVRKSDAMEIDTGATVRAAARSGIIVEPVMKLRRKNTAKLLVLIDSSEAMTPWRQFETVLVDSLDPRTSRLNAVEVRYFNGAPGEKAFRERNLRKAESLREVLKRNSMSPVLVLGEGGVVQPRRGPSFRGRMEKLLASAGEFENRPLIWVNPMPQRRWPGSLMDFLKGRPNVYAVELSPEALLRAVDLMRGVAG